LIKEKIELKPIQLIGHLGIHYENKDIASFSIVANSCCIDLLVCRGADKHIRASIDTAREFSKKKISFTDSNPTAAYNGLCVQSFFYYDVFLTTNQRAISFALTAFFICTLCPALHGTPLVLHQPIVILVIHTTEFSLR
jgi:hypothetical protein